MANNQNLIPNNKRSPSEVRENGRKGGLKSAEKRREKKSMSETINLLMGLPVKNEKAKQQLEQLGLEDSDINNQTAMIVSMYNQALKGNVQAFNTLKDTSGNNYADVKEASQKEETIEHNICIPAKDIAMQFCDINRDIDDRCHREYYLEGGRGSTKSSFVSEKCIEILENNPRMCMVALRKVKDTLKDSVYSQTEWAIDTLSESYVGIKDEWKLIKNPLEITNKRTGQKIYFRGADDYGKIKSLKPPKDMYIGIVWYEEFDQFNGMTEIRKINQSLMRRWRGFYILLHI